MTADRPHILLLDEPTNHLDVVSREALIQAINAFEGAVVIVSHDPHVLELTVDRFWLVDDGRVETVRRRHGGLPGVAAGAPSRRPRRRQESQRQPRPARQEGTAQAGGGPPAGAGAAEEAAAARRRPPSPGWKRERERITRAMADPALYDGGAASLVELQKQLGSVERDLADAEQAWMSLQEDWDRAQAEAS